MKTFYFTFGSWEKYPYQNTYLIAIANNKNDAIQTFREKYPDVTPNTVNCAFIYDEDEWKNNVCNYYTEPAAILMHKYPPRLFVDADGTLAEWRNITMPLDKHEDAESTAKKLFDILQTPGYFYSLAPNQNVIDAITQIVEEGEIEVYLLTCYPTDGEKSSPKREKNAWFDKYIPVIDDSHRIYVPYGEPKSNYIPNGVQSNDYIFDDKTSNIVDFCEHGGKGIKLLNNINSSNGTWMGDKISYLQSSKVIAQKIKNIVLKKQKVRDMKPPRMEDKFDYNAFDFQPYAQEIYKTDNIEHDYNKE